MTGRTSWMSMLCCGLHMTGYGKLKYCRLITFLVASHHRHATFCSSLGSHADFLHGRVNLGRDKEDLKAKFVMLMDLATSPSF